MEYPKIDGKEIDSERFDILKDIVLNYLNMNLDEVKKMDKDIISYNIAFLIISDKSKEKENIIENLRMLDKKIPELDQEFLEKFVPYTIDDAIKLIK